MWCGRLLATTPRPQVTKAVEALGAGEILLNCIDNDGQNDGYDLELVRSVREVSVPKRTHCDAPTTQRLGWI